LGSSPESGRGGWEAAAEVRAWEGVVSVLAIAEGVLAVTMVAAAGVACG